jgi:glycosyltransferase involved in cell wall biosynthesis
MTVVHALREERLQPVHQSRHRPTVLHVVLSLWPGGTEQLVIEICRRSAGQFRPVVCCLDDHGSWGADLAKRGTDVIALGRRPGFQPSLGYQIARLAARYDASVLHCHHYSPFVYGRLAKLVRPGLQVVFTEHGRYNDGPPLPKRKAVNPWLARIPGPIYAVSESLREHMVAEGYPANRVSVIHNGIDPGPTPGRFERQRARAVLGASEQTFLVGTAARLDSVKDLPTLVTAFASLRLQQPCARLVIAGEGQERPALERQIADLGLGADVSLLGHREDVRALMPGFDAYVNCSISEGISVTILEAMAACVPVVATRVGGNPEIVVDGRNGLLVPARTPSELASAMNRLARAPETREAFGREGRRTVERDFRIDQMVDNYARIYRALAS